MTVQNIFDKVKFISQIDAVDVSDVQLYRLLNDAISEQIKFVSGLRDDFLLKEGTAINLVADTSDYTLATDVLQIKKMKLSYDGSNFYVAYEKDLNEVTDLVNETEAQSAPKYTFIDQTNSTELKIRIHPTPSSNVTNGLAYWYIARPAELSSSSEVPVTPPELHSALVQTMIRDLKQRSGDSSGLQLADMEVQKMNAEYRNGIGTRNIDKWEGFYAPTFQE